MNTGSKTMVHMRWTCVALAALLAGCAGNAYMDAKRNTAVGGQIDRDTSKANADLEDARRRNAQLQDDKIRIASQIEQDRRRIATVEGDLRRQDAALATALKAGKLSRGRHASLKKELDALRADTQSADMANRSQAFNRGSDPKADAEKEQQLRNLERRKQELEAALAAMAK